MNLKQKTVSFIREITIIVIGVLAALFINNWNEEVKQKKYVNKTLYAIGEEIESTTDDLRSTLEKHIWTVDSIEASYTDDTETIIDIFIKINGFQIPEIKNIGLRFFVNNNAELIDYEIISDLLEIEFLSKGFEMKVNRLSDLGYNLMHNTEKENKMKVVQMLRDVIESEQGLLEQYENFLTKYEVSLQSSRRLTVE